MLVSASALAFGSIGAAIALRTNSASVVQGLFPLVFVILFLSSAFFPANLMLEPAASVADYNPLSFIVEGLRAPIIASLRRRRRAAGGRRRARGDGASASGSARWRCAGGCRRGV